MLVAALASGGGGVVEIHEASWWNVFWYLSQTESDVVIIWALSMVMGFTMSRFFFFHLRLLCSNVTTHEHYKWIDVLAFHECMVRCHTRTPPCACLTHPARRRARQEKAQTIIEALEAEGELGEVDFGNDTGQQLFPMDIVQ
jgi:hypothetical protein